MDKPSLYSPVLITFGDDCASFAWDGSGMAPCRHYPTGPRSGAVGLYRLEGAVLQQTLKTVHVQFSPVPNGSGNADADALISIDLSDDVMDALLHLRGRRAVPL